MLGIFDKETKVWKTFIRLATVIDEQNAVWEGQETASPWQILKGQMVFFEQFHTVPPDFGTGYLKIALDQKQALYGYYKILESTAKEEPEDKESSKLIRALTKVFPEIKKNTKSDLMQALDNLFNTIEKEYQNNKKLSDKFNKVTPTP